MMSVRDELLPSFAVLRTAYPRGLPDEDYLPLLAVLHDGYSARQLAALVAEFAGRERVVVDNDHARVVSGQPPDRAQVAAVRSRLAEAGYDALNHDE
jgi:hypothetical protein